MPATGATRKEPENSVNPGGRPGSARGCSDAAAGLQQRSFCEGARRSRSGYLSNGPQGLKWILRTRVSARSLGIRGLIEGSIGRGAPVAAGQGGHLGRNDLGVFHPKVRASWRIYLPGVSKTHRQTTAPTSWNRVGQLGLRNLVKTKSFRREATRMHFRLNSLAILRL